MQDPFYKKEKNERQILKNVYSVCYSIVVCMSLFYSLFQKNDV